MKVIFSAYVILALVACTAQSSTPPTGAAPATPRTTPASYAAGSAANTTTAFDGTWVADPVQNRSKGSALPSGGEGFSSCPDYGPQNMTISNGLAQFSALNRGSIYEGYVTPQGGLELLNGLGARFVGQIGSDNVARGRIIGTCVYELTWRKSA
jgi:ABC-type transport system substrate-binding protein